MAKKIRFPLEMDQGVEVRSLDELKDNFSLVRVLDYISNGKLVTWLKDRYYNDIADSLEALNLNDGELPKKVCEIFDITYDEAIVTEMKEAEERNHKLNLLKEHTTNKKFFDVVDNIAFSQDELYDLLDEQINTIYLCGERFTIPLSKSGMTYIGINNPTAVIDAKEEVNWSEKDITLSDVRYDDEYQQIADAAYMKKHGLSKPFLEVINSGKLDQPSREIGYSRNTYLNFMLSAEDKESAEGCFNALSKEIGNIHYDIDADISKLRRQLRNLGLVGMANKYIESL